MGQGASERPSAYDNVKRQFDKAADLMKLDQDIRKILATTENEIIVLFPVKITRPLGTLQLNAGIQCILKESGTSPKPSCRRA